MRRFSSRLTSGRKSTPRTRAKIAALAPMPSASVSATVMARPLVRASERSATLKSRRNDIFCSSVGGWSATYLNLVQERGETGKCFCSSTPGDGPDDQQRLLPGYHGVGHRALRGRTRDVELHLTADARQSAQMWREYHPNHGSVWTSTESTAGRSRTMGAQLSPASAEAYT